MLGLERAQEPVNGSPHPAVVLASGERRIVFVVDESFEWEGDVRLDRPWAETVIYELHVKGFTRLTAFWLKYFDHLLIDRPGGIDAASGVFFLGRRSDTALPDAELIAQYRGAL